MTDNAKYDVILLLRGYNAYMSVQQVPVIRIGVVPFLNATPLIEGISSIEGIELIHKVPSELVACLERNEVDIALASSIDYQKSSLELGILPVGVLSSDGNSLTVQLCSRVPFQKVTRVYCDSDSHTSVALLQIILNNLHDVTLEIVPTDFRLMGECDSSWPETVLLIGDKVVTSQYEIQYPFALDLGQAWKKQTGLPFVFATWLCRLDLPKSKIHTLSMVFQRQLLFNQQRMEQVVCSHAPSRGWDTSGAIEYVNQNMYYRFEDRHLKSLELFYNLAHSIGILQEVRQLQLLSS